METDKLVSINILPQAKNPIFEQRETCVTHTPYMVETAFYSLVQAGDVEKVKNSIDNFIKDGIVIGRLSNDALRQMQYWAVCCITLGTRYAIQGGLEEMIAYNLADSFIIKIDKMTKPEEIVDYLITVFIKITESVKERAHPTYSKEIHACINFIDKHLHEKLTIEGIATSIGYSKSWLPKKFKKETGMAITDYVTSKKIEEAKSLLRSNTPQNIIAYSLGFCSQTHFIQCFKKYCGITPNQFARRL